jgi:hypothetical protein
MSGVEKETMRDLAIRGGPYSAAERKALLQYCQSDVDSLAQLVWAMLPHIDLPRALLRGRYMPAAAHMEWNGVPIDTDIFSRFRDNWSAIKRRLIRAVNKDYGVFVPVRQRKCDTTIAHCAAEQVTSGPDEVAHSLEPTRFSGERWANYLARKGIPWPLLPSGAPVLDDDTFREMARTFPAEVAPIRELRHTLSQLRLNELSVGSDGRNRYLLSAFGSRTSRNQPSNSRFVFGQSVWLRSLIKPAPGRAVAYIDWSQQELGIAAALSGDRRMQEAYVSDDFYLTFAKLAGAVPRNGTKQTHRKEREQFKTVALGVLYGLGDRGLARKLGVAPCRGGELLRVHQETFRRFWEWSNQIEMQGMITGYLDTVFGWRVHVGHDVNPRSLRNFPMQANAAEMLRLACCMATEQGIIVCAPVHDALLIEGAANNIETVVETTQKIMREASEIVLPGFPLRTDAKVVRFPDRYMDERGRRMWDTVISILEQLRGEASYYR